MTFPRRFTHCGTPTHVSALKEEQHAQEINKRNRHRHRKPNSRDNADTASSVDNRSLYSSQSASIGRPSSTGTNSPRPSDRVGGSSQQRTESPVSLPHGGHDSLGVRTQHHRKDVIDDPASNAHQ